MAVPVFGPGHNASDNATTTRVTQKVVGGATDTWFKPCTSEGAKDGSRVSAQFLNFLVANFRAAVRGLGVAEDTTDDDMILKCFQAVAFDDWINLPIFPESLESGYTLGITDLGGGQIRIDGGLSFLHRGCKRVDTSSYNDAARTLNHSANKTYHVRWQYNAGAPEFAIKDTADGVYNPGVLDEGNAAFDTTYDDMLIAKVVTDGSNVPTMTLLQNKAVLAADAKAYDDSVINPNQNASHMLYSILLNWSRTPIASAVQWCAGSPSSVSGAGNDADLLITGGLIGSGEGDFIQPGSHDATWNRYSLKGAFMRDGSTKLGLRFNARA